MGGIEKGTKEVTTGKQESGKMPSYFRRPRKSYCFL